MSYTRPVYRLWNVETYRVINIHYVLEGSVINNIHADEKWAIKTRPLYRLRNAETYRVINIHDVLEGSVISNIHAVLECSVISQCDTIIIDKRTLSQNAIYIYPAMPISHSNAHFTLLSKFYPAMPTLTCYVHFICYAHFTLLCQYVMWPHVREAKLQILFLSTS